MHGIFHSRPPQAGCSPKCPARRRCGIRSGKHHHSANCNIVEARLYSLRQRKGYLSRALQEQGLHVLALDSNEIQTSGANKWKIKDALRRAHEQRRAVFQKDHSCANPTPCSPTPTVPVGNGSLTHRTVHIQQKSLEVAVSEWLCFGVPGFPSSQDPIPITFVALHACGSLTVDILRAFLAHWEKAEDSKSPRTWEPHSLVVVGCCYNLISPSGKLIYSLS